VTAVPARLRLALIALTLCAIAAVAGITVAQSRVKDKPLNLTNGFAGALRPANQRVPSFTLTDQDGHTVTSASLKGEPTVFAFVYSHCRDTCPAQVQTIRGALDDLGTAKAAHIHVIGISVDPANDTPKSAQSFLLEQSMTGRMQFLLGTRQQLAPIWKAFAVQPQEQGLEHSAHTVLADPRGMQRVGFPFDELTSERLAHDLSRL
jgi:protein SCO1